MKKPDSIARRLSHVSREERATKPIEIMEIVEGAQCTAAYIAQMRESLRTLRMERVFRVWLIFSRGLSSKPSFGRVNANECSGRMPALNFSHARADPVHEIASLACEAASPLAPNSRRRISKSGASVSVSGSFRRRAQDGLDDRNEKDYKNSMNRRQVELLA
jgi:hypothetical protein